MSNEDYKKTFQLIYTKYEALTTIHHTNLESIKKLAEDADTRYYQDENYFYIGNRGVGTFKEDYAKLKAELAKPEYQAILNKLLK